MPDPVQTLTPEEALKHLDTAAADRMGTRADHRLLQASTMMLHQTLQEWRVLKQHQLEAAEAEAKANAAKEAEVLPLKAEDPPEEEPKKQKSKKGRRSLAAVKR